MLQTERGQRLFFEYYFCNQSVLKKSLIDIIWKKHCGISYITESSQCFF